MLGKGFGLFHGDPMSYTFEIERTTVGRYKLVVRSEDDTWILQSTDLDDARSAALALDQLRASLGKDWRYRILSVRHRGPTFVIELSNPPAACRSKEFSSCDAMDREIAHLKSSVQSIELAQAYDET